jgi:hypothetical protein
MDALLHLGANLPETLLYSLLQLIPNLIYSIWLGVAYIVGIIEQIFRILSGLENPPGSQTSFATGVINPDGPLGPMFTNLIAVCAVIMFFFTIVVIVRENYKNKDGGSPMTIVFRTIKGFVLFIFIQAACIVGLELSTVLLKSLDAAVGGNTHISMSANIFSAMSYNANFARIGPGNVDSVQRDKYNALFGDNYQAPDFGPQYKQWMGDRDYAFLLGATGLKTPEFMAAQAFVDSSGGSIPQDYAFAEVAMEAGSLGGSLSGMYQNWGDTPNELARFIDDLMVGKIDGNAIPENTGEYCHLYVYTDKYFFSEDICHDAGYITYENIEVVKELYEVYRFDWIIGIGGLFMLVGVYLNFAFGLVQRVVTLAVLYVMSPITLAFYPFDDGQAFNGQFVKPFYKQAISTYAVVLSLNIYPVIYTAIMYPGDKPLEFFTAENGIAYEVMNQIARVIVSLALLGVLPKIRSTITNMLGADSIEEKKIGDVVKSGWNTLSAKGVRKHAKKAFKQGHKFVDKALDWNQKYKVHKELVAKSDYGKAQSVIKDGKKERNQLKRAMMDRGNQDPKKQEEIQRQIAAAESKIAAGKKERNLAREVTGGHGALYNSLFEQGTGMFWDTHLGKSIDKTSAFQHDKLRNSMEKTRVDRRSVDAIGAGRVPKIYEEVYNAWASNNNINSAVDVLNKNEKGEKLSKEEQELYNNITKGGKLYQGQGAGSKYLSDNEAKMVNNDGMIKKYSDTMEMDQNTVIENSKKWFNVTDKSSKYYGMRRAFGAAQDNDPEEAERIVAEMEGRGAITTEEAARARTNLADKSKRKAWFSDFEMEEMSIKNEMVYGMGPKKLRRIADLDQAEKALDRTSAVDSMRMGQETLKAMQGAIAQVGPEFGKVLKSSLFTDNVTQQGFLFEFGAKLNDYLDGKNVRFSKNETENVEIKNLLDASSKEDIATNARIMTQSIGNPFGEMRGNGVSQAQNIVAAGIYAEFASYANESVKAKVGLVDGMLTQMVAEMENLGSTIQKEFTGTYAQMLGLANDYIGKKVNEETSEKFAKDMEAVLEKYANIPEAKRSIEYEDLEGQKHTRMLSNQELAAMSQFAKRVGEYAPGMKHAQELQDQETHLIGVGNQLSKDMQAILSALRYKGTNL